MKAWGYAFGALCSVHIAGPLMAQQSSYSPVQTQSCLSNLPAGTSISSCAGRSADACIEKDGASTIAISQCVNSEVNAWTLLMGQTYAAALRRAEQADAEMNGFGDSQHEALQGTQSTWTFYSDAVCEFERSKFGGGSGGGPAALYCMLNMTAARTEWLAQSFEY